MSCEIEGGARIPAPQDDNLLPPSDPTNPASFSEEIPAAQNAPEEVALDTSAAETSATQPEIPVGPPISAEDLGQLYEEYSEPLRAYLARLVRNRELAADLRQQVFEKALRSLQGDAKGRIVNARAWLYRIATNAAYDSLRRDRLIEWVPYDKLEPEDNPKQQNTYGDVMRTRAAAQTTPFEDEVAEKDVFNEALRTIPAHYASALILRHVNRWSYEEIAETLHTAPSGMKMLLSRALREFKTAYNDARERSA